MREKFGVNADVGFDGDAIATGGPTIVDEDDLE